MQHGRRRTPPASLGGTTAYDPSRASVSRQEQAAVRAGRTTLPLTVQRYMAVRQPASRSKTDQLLGLDLGSRVLVVDEAVAVGVEAEPGGDGVGKRQPRRLAVGAFEILGAADATCRRGSKRGERAQGKRQAPAPHRGVPVTHVGGQSAFASVRRTLNGMNLGSSVRWTS